MLGGKPDLVSEMYSPRARMRLGSDQSEASCLMEGTSFSRRFLAPDRAGQVRMEGFWSGSTTGAGGVGVIVEPGGVGGQVAFSCSHLVDSACHKLSQPHKGVWCEGGGVYVVGGVGALMTQSWRSMSLAGFLRAR